MTRTAVLATTTALVMVAMAIPSAGAAELPEDCPLVRLDTSKGTIVLALAPEAAPATVDNFLGYVRAGFYDGTIFHRVIPGFMIQGGGFTPEMRQKPTGDPIANEAGELRNRRGTVAMARRADPHSATAQFFVNVDDNRALDHTRETKSGWGYAVFGEVVEGMDVVDAIVGVPTGTRGPFRDVPVDPVVIERAVVIGPGPKTDG